MATEESIFNPHSAEDIRQCLTTAILLRWPMPAIEPKLPHTSYAISEDESLFVINSFGAVYEVTIKKVQG